MFVENVLNLGIWRSLAVYDRYAEKSDDDDSFHLQKVQSNDAARTTCERPLCAGSRAVYFYVTFLESLQNHSAYRS